MKNLKSEFEGNSILNQKGIDDFVYDWTTCDPDTAKCSKEEKENILGILKEDPSQMDALKKLVLERTPYAYPYSVVWQDGYIDYIEDKCFERPFKCSSENRKRIECLLEEFPDQNKLLRPDLEFELANGRGSLRKEIEKGAARSLTFEEHLEKMEKTWG